ncbi:hypothetical protein [Pseudomonas mosselii]|uniref:hypothetical protein n=1 Tax=Pseudomonas mosselii TaxID=78327 RepID=UPI0021D97AF5|nr:hypothetical protein [Pseudomonas mosselii]MCU9528482.1 hypothetical protein [Pseudomonas mosselii]MCU9535816.1 hypothetical protein [Pseudomonas mosselii]MCU9543871.1 hypothetical protein [Pseudomonas mosselii]MCU9550456.1 hypothetical protein [Pseudomonas mosselii]
MNTQITNEPKKKRPIATLGGLTALILAQFLSAHAWLQNLLIIIGVAGFALEGLFVVQYNNAHKKWLASQPDLADPLRGAPNLPHLKQTIAMGVGMGALLTLAYFGIPLRDNGFTDADWWLLLLIPVVFAGFGVSSRIQEKHNKAFMAWSNSQTHNK